MQQQQPLILGHRYRVPSGLGGVFDVRLLSITEESGATVRVDMAGNPDWHNWTVCCDPAELRPIPTRYQVRTRVGAERGDYLSWGRFDTRAEAEAAAERARTYPACHPVAIVPVEG